MSTEDARRILEQALRLPPEARAAIAGSLLESLDPTMDQRSEEAWARELTRRVRELDDGTVSPVPWSEARRRILGDA